MKWMEGKKWVTMDEQWIKFDEMDKSGQMDESGLRWMIVDEN